MLAAVKVEVEAEVVALKVMKLMKYYLKIRELDQILIALKKMKMIFEFKITFYLII